MGDISVDLFLETLKQLLTTSNLDFTIEEQYQLEALEEEIKYLRRFLKIVEKRRNTHLEVMNLVVQIRDVVSKAENAVELFIVLVSKDDHASNSLREHKDHLFVDLEGVEKDIKNLEAEVKQNFDMMGNISLHFFLEITLKQFFMDFGGHFTEEEKIQLRSVEKEIIDQRGLVNIVEKKHKNHSEAMNLGMQIEDVISIAEKAIKLFKVDGSRADYGYYRTHDQSERKNRLFLDLERVKKDIQNLTFEVTLICDEILSPVSGAAVRSPEHSSTGSRGGSSSLGGSNPSEVLEEKVVVGFEEEVAELLDVLFDRSLFFECLGIISITGPGGCGKTTLARELYRHHSTIMTFEIRAWIVVPQDYDQTMKKDLLIDILKSVSPETYRDYEKSSEHDLVQKLFELLMGKTYLIVMENIWDVVAWNDISLSFPGESLSRVVFTSRVQVEFCRVADHDSYYESVHHHRVKPLSKICSWELLKVKVFGKTSFPLELVEIGKQIANKCEGLPLAIVAIAGILATNEKTLNVWQQIAKDVSSIIAKKTEGCMELLELSYNNLPPHLKACFLYVGAYPEGYEISVRELTWLWITEGFIQEDRVWGNNLETVAKRCLTDLIDRNLVMIARRTSIGENKTCRINDLLRQLCLKKAEEENFFAQIDGDDSFVPSAINKHRRLFVFRQFFDKFFFSRPYPQNLRSFLCLGSRHSRIELYMSFFVETFKLLRVFSFVADECQGEILRGQLVHLRYLALRLPKGNLFCSLNPFHFLSNLEILNLQVSCMDKISLPRDIVNMVKLRHLYSKGGIFECHHVCYDEDEGNMLDSLQTLHRMCFCEHCLRFLERTPNLRKLGLIGDPDRKGDDVLMLSVHLESLKCLEILRVESVRISCIGLRLPPTLTQLSLKQTNLKWEQLSILLQALPSLEVLKLLAGACRGPVWDTSELKLFRFHLKCLKLDSLDIEEWKACRYQFLHVVTLVIRHCKVLKGIPIAFAERYLSHTREILVEWCRHSVEESARKLQEGRSCNLNLVLRFNEL